jgi:predicted TIM-barrel fold metal-dependent hydrolase
MVFDTHTHAWGPPTEEHPWTNGPLVENFANHFSTDIVYDAERLLGDMDDTGIDEAVVVGYPITDWTDNSYTVEAAELHERLFGIAMIDQFADRAAETLREVMATDRMLGFRLGAVCPYDQMWQAFDYEQTWLRDAIEEEAFWEAALETDAIVQILAHTSQLDQVLELVERYPDLQVVFDHFAHADADDDPAESYEAFEPLAQHDTVGVKISEISHTSNEMYPFEDAYDHVHWLVDTFGKARVFWGSDFPNVSHPEFGGMSFDETLSWLDHVPFLSENDRKWLTDRGFREYADL